MHVKYMLAVLILLPAILWVPIPSYKPIVVFAGSAVKPALEEAAYTFEQQHDVQVELHFGGSGGMLSRMKLSNKGDIYIAGSPDFMEKAIEDGVVENHTTIITYLIPAIIVRKDSNITSLSELASEDVRVGIADPYSVAIGRYAAEILNQSGFDINITSKFESASKTTSALMLGSVDAIINWRVTAGWNHKLKAIPLRREEIPRISYVSASIAEKSRNKEMAEEFLMFLTSQEGRAIFEKHGYITDKHRALTLSNTSALIGGTPVW